MFCYKSNPFNFLIFAQILVMSQFHSLKIQQLDKITDKAVRISFEIPKELKKDYVFKAGQYITIKAKLNGEEIRRDYSICSTANSTRLEVAVKEVENGFFSKFANNNLKAGDVLEVSVPHGRFTLEANPSNKRTVLTFAAGSGITPIMSIVKTLLTEEPQSKIILMYGNRQLKDVMFLNDLLTLQLFYPKRFRLHFIYSQTEEENALFGHIEKSTVNYLIKNIYKEESMDAFYICGPTGMITTVKDTLLEQGIAEDKIHFELFTVPVSNETKTIAAEGEAEVTVIVDEEEITFNMSQKHTILEAAIKHNVDAPYSCQGGVCASCLGRLKEGTASMRVNNVLTDSEIEDGLILTCQAQPTSAKVVVDYDDV